jgi:DNA/RNA endonuclease G (NUC1)
MRLRIVSAALAALALVTVSCSENEITGPKAGPAIGAPRFDFSAAAITLPQVRISEFHYDNAGTDVGESVEISGPAGTSLTGWSLVFYNGDGGAVYRTTALTGTFPNSCSGRGVVVAALPVNGIQNGNPDGIALVNGTTVVDFISYGGSFPAVGGAAGGTFPRDIGVTELGTTPIGNSLSIDGAGTWLPPAANTFGTCNDDQPPSAANTVATVTVTPETVTGFPGAISNFTAVARNAANEVIPGALITWTSSDNTVATVDLSGHVTGLTAGTTTITGTASNGISGSAILNILATPALPATRFSEIHYDNSGVDINEAIEIEGPAGTSVTGWKIILYTGSDGTVYSSDILAGNGPSMCDGRGVVYLTYPSNGIQNGSPDGFALVDASDNVIEFLSYEGTFTATDGPAAGLTSRDIGVSETGSVAGQSLSRNAAGTWLASGAPTIGACNSGVGPPPPPPGNGITISGRDPFSDVPLPVGFEDQLFATLLSGTGVAIPTTFTWTSETPALASIDQNGVIRALGAGTAVVRATATDGTTRAYALPTRVAVASSTAMYAGNTEFGIPADGTPADDYLVTRTEYTASFNVNRGTPNWVSYDLDPTHFGAEDRCDCFTYDPLLPAAGSLTTADYTGAGAVAGYQIDRGHMARSFDRTSGSLDNARTFYFTNIVPQAADLNQGPWANMENALGDLARLQNKEVYIIAGVAGNKGTLKNEGKIVIPDYTWKVALILPHDQGLANVDSYDDVQVIAAVMPNEPGIRNVDWHTYQVTVDSVEALSGYDLLALLPDPVETAVESNTVPPVAATDGPYSGYLPHESISMSGAASSDADAGQTLTYAWDFGDGSTASGVSVSHPYAAAGTYNVRLIVTDPLGLADTVTTTATVMTQSQAANNARTLISQLLTDGKIDAATANSLTKKLDAAIASFARGGPAVNQLNALLNQINDLVATGVLSSTDAAPLISLVNRIIASV